MSMISVHDDWLSLIEISGPFLAVPVLKEAFPQGLEELIGIKRKRLRQAYEEWREALELEDAQFAELHAAWIDEVLSRGLELDEDGKGDVLKRADWCAANLRASLPEHGVTLSPDLVVIDDHRANKPLLLIQTYAQDVDLDATLKQNGWAATPADRMVALCRALGCRLGLVTNGERWMLVDAPVGAVTTFASWYARIWSQEPITLQTFVHLLGIRRFFVDESEQLPALFDRSLKFQDEVTDALGEQVRRAVEVLIQALDKADQDRNRELLYDVKEPELYEAALTVMMRLVFLLSAEERGLLLMGDERYEANYALSTLRMQLRKESEEILERRWDAWSRLLAIFRVVFGGIEHENLRLPALGGSLFDPDRFPFLEGRAKGSNWCTDAATPLPIDNRTVLLLLEAIQQFQGRILSYRALDVEQIGYVYEGLLERTVKRTNEVTLELDATKSAKTPWIKLAELESARLDGAARVAKLLQERSGSSASRVRNDLAKSVDDTLADSLLTACQGDTKLRDRVKPYAHLLRTDPWGYPLVYPAGAFIVTSGSDRRETGTHYTPKSLTEAIVAETLTPVVYVGPAEGIPRDRWALKSPAELLDLKICDPAMGSGAFLVQACRWLSDRLVEAWSQTEATGKTVSVDGEVLEARAAKEPLPRDSEARTVIARRLISERCLYGVDLNPLAVELAKLSIWLVTLAKGRPFGFLDHNLRCGDSLLGIHRLDQLTQLSMNPTGQGQLRLFGQNIERAVREAIELRQRLREMPIRDIRDVEAMARLDTDARQMLEVPERIADALIGEVFALGGNGVALESALASLAVQAGQAIEGAREGLASMCRRSVAALSTDLPAEKPGRRPFHWPLEFPEVLKVGGFDCIIGNPPFLGGLKLFTNFGEAYRAHLIGTLANGVTGTRGAADFCTYFFLRAIQLLSPQRTLGFVATNSIAQGDSKVVGFEQITRKNSIYLATSSMPWPGSASLSISVVHIFTGDWGGCRSLDDQSVDYISPGLSRVSLGTLAPQRLEANKDLSFQGSNVCGNGFVVCEEIARQTISRNGEYSNVLMPYLNGRDFNSSSTQRASRWIINFYDWPLKRDVTLPSWTAMSRSQQNKSQSEGIVPQDYPYDVAGDYPLCTEIIEREVKPERELLKPINAFNKTAARVWWQHGGPRVALYKKLSRISRVLVTARVSGTNAVAWADPNQTFDVQLICFPVDDDAFFSIMQSSFHWIWVGSTSSTLGDAGNIRYTPTSCFQTFPLPNRTKELENIGNKFNRIRQLIMSDCNIGLTDLYKRLHNSEDSSADIVELRALHVKMDEAVSSSYGWEDIRLDHGFNSVRSGIRFTVSEGTRQEILQRLLNLNRQYHEAEQATSDAPDSRKRGRSRKNSSSLILSGDLFDGEGA